MAEKKKVRGADVRLPRTLGAQHRLPPADTGSHLIQGQHSEKKKLGDYPPSFPFAEGRSRDRREEALRSLLRDVIMDWYCLTRGLIYPPTPLLDL